MADPIRALTIRQPFADAIARGEKKIENRSRRTTYRGQLLIHAGLIGDRRAVLDGVQPGADARGAIIAVAELAGCHQDADPAAPCDSWALPGLWHWELADVRPLLRPVPAKGRLGLWVPDAGTLAAVEAQLTGMAARR